MFRACRPSRQRLATRMLPHPGFPNLEPHIYIYIYIYTHRHTFLMQGCHTPPSPSPWYPPLPVKWVVVLFGLVAFPVWSCLASSPPTPLWSGTCGLVFLVGPAPPVGASVFYRGMVWLLPLVSSNVIVTCLVPSPPLWGGACGRFRWPRPACVGQCVLQRYGMVAATC